MDKEFYNVYALYSIEFLKELKQGNSIKDESNVWYQFLVLDFLNYYYKKANPKATSVSLTSKWGCIKNERVTIALNPSWVQDDTNVLFIEVTYYSDKPPISLHYDEYRMESDTWLNHYGKKGEILVIPIKEISFKFFLDQLPPDIAVFLLQLVEAEFMTHIRKTDQLKGYLQAIRNLYGI